jgi:hypothetical protein
MLREAGKRDIEEEEGFLKVHNQKMPRTMLRHAIEKFATSKRKAYFKEKSDSPESDAWPAAKIYSLSQLQKTHQHR